MELKKLLVDQGIKPSSVVQFDNHLTLDLSKNNQALSKVDLNDEEAFTQFIFNQIKSSGKDVAIGGYGEERDLYSRSNLFVGEEPRTIHLGVDIWAPSGTPVYAPLDGIIHSYANRAVHGDYGPVIILEHQLGEKSLFSLYGHLSSESLEGKKLGQFIKKGARLAWFGKYEENFHWPPHLHFQLMWDMQDNVGDYPGVCKDSERIGYLKNCPDPTIFIL